MPIQNRILVVDDDPVNINVIKEGFQGRFDLRSVESGEEAIKVAQEFRPDLVLLDIMMPGMDGYQTCKKIKENPALRFTKVLMVSAKSMVDERLTGYDCGADDYITKPFNDDELSAKVRVYLNLKFKQEFRELKNNVLRLISQEIRGPLLSVMESMGTVTRLKEDNLAGAKQSLERIIKHGHRLMQLCDESMLLCDIKDGRGVDREKLQFRAFLLELLQDLSTAMKTKRIKVELMGGLDFSWNADPVLLKKALMLILENAIAYSPAGGRIRIFSHEDQRQRLIVIDDQGQGVVGRFFDEIYHSEDSEDQIGAGVGFSVAQIAARLNGGGLSFKRNPSGGASFMFSIPKEKDQHLLP